MVKKITEFRKNFDLSEYTKKVSGSKDRMWVEKRLKKVFDGKIIRSDKTLLVPGKIYLFMYDAKYKDTLPIWDVFPLVLVVESNNKYIKGLNLHYVLSPLQRQYVIESIIKKDSKPITKDYSIPINKSGSTGILPQQLIDRSYRNYLKSHLKSYILVIPATEWVNALRLPLGLFIAN
mgnify:CR=1 FL=1